MNEYKHKEKFKPETLLLMMREVLDQSIDFNYINGIQPFFMSFGNQKYYVYVKNISSAYFSDRDKTTRAQLPIRPEFDLIKSSPYPFIFLGYDGINDVLICWNFYIAKNRLNVGKSVSFYSRSFFQSEVKDGEFARRRLKNGDLPVLFKRTNLIEFFKRIDTFFLNDISLKSDKNSYVGQYNYEQDFKNFLKDKKNLSEKSIKSYTNALRGRISDGIRKNYIKSLDTIFFIEDISFLERLNRQLFEIEEYKLLDSVGKNMYSCAFNNFIAFINYKSNNEINENQNMVNDIQENYLTENKLLKIDDLDLINEIEPYIRSNRLLSAAQIVGDYYQNKYTKMELSDWISLVRNIKYTN